MSIKALDQNTVKSLTTAQIITSVATAVKELVENSIDAQAKSIEINLIDDGASLIEVSDNGTGISKEDTRFMALQSYTSKISDFKDLDSLESYGFRGEALNALCQVAEVTVVTRTVEEETARCYTLDSDGNIENCKVCHHSVGTTVRAKSLFKHLPVRRKALMTSKRSSQDVKNLLRAYAICQPQMRIHLRANGFDLLTKLPTEKPRDTLSALFGIKFSSQIDFITRNMDETTIHLFIPQKDATELSDVCQAGQYTFVNQRPVSQKEFEKTINKRMVEYFGDKIPSKKKLSFGLSLQVPTSNIDVNLEPNKTKIFLTNQSKILETLDEMLSKYYELKAQDEDVAGEKIADVDESLEYHDATSSEINVSAENFNPPSSKKRKIEAEPKKTPGRINRNANKENRWSNVAETLENSVEPPETISQLPVVDLGEDFTMEEISRLPQLDPGRVETTLKEIIEQNRGSNDEERKTNENFSLEAWSKGHIPTNLQGGTDVHTYGNFVKNANRETMAMRQEPEVSSSTACKGFSKFSKEMRRSIIEENPGINFVEVAKALTKRWKELSPEERGYYRDLAANEEESSTQLKKFDTTIAPTKSQKVPKVSADLSQKNKQRLVDMLENMKLAKKKDNSMTKTVVPCTIDLERVEQKFIVSRSKIPAINNKNVVVGPLNEKLWIVRTSFQLWALDHEQLYRGLDIEPNSMEETRESLGKIMERWLHEKDGMSLFHPIFNLR